MCGIAGILSPRPETAMVRRMMSAIAHRGPDGDGVWSAQAQGGRHLTLGHVRLAIIDLTAAGAQPMVDPASGVALTYNGEIYNYLEVRAELKALGATFRSDSDTEVIIEAYKRWGVDCLARLNGMFALALYDPARNTLFCARDRFGEKPFLYAAGRDHFVFGSEYKALLQDPRVSLNIDEGRLIKAAYRQSVGLDGDRQSLFDDIQQLLPGEAMEVDIATLRTRTWRYWQVQPAGAAAAPARADAEVFAEFRDLLTDAVRLRLRSDVTVGSCLSGGLDSSAIVCIARRLLGDDAPYQSFTGRFPGTAADEWRYAEEVVNAAGTTAHTTDPTVDRFLADLPDFIWFNELPVGSSSQFAQWCVFRLAKAQGVTVLLDGQGADELLGGYEQTFAAYVQALRERGEQSRLDAELPAIRARYPLALATSGRALRDRAPFGLRHWISNVSGRGSSLLFAMPAKVARTVAVETAFQRLEGFDPLQSTLVQDSFGRGLTTLLRYGDRNSMAHSREVRLPFCDHRLAEFTLNLPPHLLMGEVQTKRLLRESMRGILPEAIRTRWNKQGFRPPQDLWFQSPALRARVRDTLSSASFRQSPMWSPGWIDGAMKRIDAGELRLGWTLWQPFIIEEWRRGFLDRLAAGRTAAVA